MVGPGKSGAGIGTDLATRKNNLCLSKRYGKPVGDGECVTTNERVKGRSSMVVAHGLLGLR